MNDLWTPRSETSPLVKGRVVVDETSNADVISEALGVGGNVIWLPPGTIGARHSPELETVRGQLDAVRPDFVYLRLAWHDEARRVGETALEYGAALGVPGTYDLALNWLDDPSDSDGKKFLNEYSAQQLGID